MACAAGLPMLQVAESLRVWQNAACGVARLSRERVEIAMRCSSSWQQDAAWQRSMAQHDSWIMTHDWQNSAQAGAAMLGNGHPAYDRVIY
eukprot:4778596-Alexandrium_andersonii.AAC.1